MTYLSRFMKFFQGNFNLHSIAIITKRTFFHITKIYSKIGLICAIFYLLFWYFRNKDHSWGLRSESKRLKVCNLLIYFFWTLKPIINNNILWNILFEDRYKSYFMNTFNDVFCNRIFSYYRFLPNFQKWLDLPKS